MGVSYKAIVVASSVAAMSLLAALIVVLLAENRFGPPAPDRRDGSSQPCHHVGSAFAGWPQ